ncbi:MAG: iron ABC transporter permease [archaeon]|nr:iron ABC transporter permease [archaeon]
MSRRIPSMMAILAVSIVLVILFAFIELAYKSGGDWYEFSQVWDTLLGNGTWGSNIIIKDINAPRVTIGIFIGMGLAVAGCAMQAVFRNPLASPYILGLSSGASVGAAFSLLVSIPFIPLVVATPMFAFATCFATMFLVYSMARTGGSVKTESLILSGVAVSALLSALVSFMTFIAGDKLEGIVFWSMGNLGNVIGDNGWKEISIMAPIIVVCCLGLITQAKKLNAMMLGDIHAMDLGVDVRNTRLLVLILTTLIVAAAVSFVGVIGFVGLVIPHILRLTAGPDNRILMPLCMILGPVFILFCDLVAHVVAEDYGVLPIGVISALIGAPLFIFLLMRRKKEIGWN